MSDKELEKIAENILLKKKYYMGVYVNNNDEANDRITNTVGKIVDEALKLGFKEGYNKAKQELIKEIERVLRIILTERNNELQIYGTKGQVRSFHLEAILHALGFNIDLIPNGVLSDKVLLEVVNNLMKDGEKFKNNIYLLGILSMDIIILIVWFTKCFSSKSLLGGD